MRALRQFVVTMFMFVPGTAFADSDAGVLRGTWKGPWYIGMSSGIASLAIAGDGSGDIALTNLDDFGSEPVKLAKQSFDGKTFAFSATGADGAALNMKLQLEDNGRKLRGNGKHAGFGARLELQRSE